MKLSNQEQQPSHRSKMIEIKDTNRKKKMTHVSQGTYILFVLFSRGRSIPANKTVHLLYLWSHHDMFKKLNCQKNSEIK